MNYKFFVIIFVAIFAAYSLVGCNDDVGQQQEGTGSSGMSVLPTDMAVGQMISISGPNFKDATSVIFPGNVSVTVLEKMGDFHVSVMVPEGTSQTGNISVMVSGQQIVIPVDVTIATTTITNIRSTTSSELNNELIWVGAFDEIFIQGTGLLDVTEVSFAGVTVPSTNFVRKNNNSVIVMVPADRDEVIDYITVITPMQTFVSTDMFDFTGKGFLPEFIRYLCGVGSKTWTWDDNSPYYNLTLPGANGGNNGHVPFTGFSGAPNIDPAHWSFQASSWVFGISQYLDEGWGASITFYFTGNPVVGFRVFFVLNKNNTGTSTGRVNIFEGQHATVWDRRDIPSSWKKPDTGFLRTSIPLLMGRHLYDFGADQTVLEYDILEISENRLILQAINDKCSWCPGAPGSSNGEEFVDWVVFTKWAFKAN
jgi:hypothetical protein